MTDGQLSCPFLHQLARLLSNSARVLSYRVSGRPTIDSRPRVRLTRPSIKGAASAIGHSNWRAEVGVAVFSDDDGLAAYFCSTNARGCRPLLRSRDGMPRSNELAVTADPRVALEHCAAKWIRFAIDNAAQHGRELIPSKWKQLYEPPETCEEIAGRMCWR